MRAAWGGLYLNGRMAHKEVQLSAPCQVEYFEPKFKIEEADKFFPEFKEEYILFEDEDLLIVFKPANLPCLPGKEQQRFHLKGCLLKYLAKSSTKAQIHLPSRLDSSVSGVIAASKSARMNKELQQAFEKRTVSKTYILEVLGHFPEDEILVEKAITRDTLHPVLRKVCEENGKPARTSFKFCALKEYTEGMPQQNTNAGNSSSLVSAKPLTGRTHQIRVHAAHLGFPIIGDNFYAGEPSDSLHLLSYSFGFFNPFSKKELRVSLPQRLYPSWLPTDFKIDTSDC